MPFSKVNIIEKEGKSIEPFVGDLTEKSFAFLLNISSLSIYSYLKNEKKKKKRVKRKDRTVAMKSLTNM